MNGTPNTNKAHVVAKYTGVSLESPNVDFGKTNKSSDFLAKFPFGKIPAMETADGPLFESNAIAYYLATKKPELLGATDYERALVIQHICCLDCELNPDVAKVIYPIFCYVPYVADQWKADVKNLLNKLKIFDEMLQPRTYFVGESVTLADIIYVCTLRRVFEHILSPADRKKLVNLTRWYVTMANQPNVKAVLGEAKLAEKMVDPAEHIKAQKAAAAPAAPRKEGGEEREEAEEEEAAPKPKPKNAMDLLPPSKLNLEEWKRFYSNCKETKPVATNWFWEHFDPEGYTIWRANYRYNDELKKIFMTCNLVTGLFARMEAMRKYCFASVIIFGEDDKNEISGFFVIRGTEMPDVMKEVPDYDCYEWTKVDITDPKQVELFNDYLAWEGELEGKTFNQGKIFK